jgi:hypothetical protein
MHLGMIASCAGTAREQSEAAPRLATGPLLAAPVCQLEAKRPASSSPSPANIRVNLHQGRVQQPEVPGPAGPTARGPAGPTVVRAADVGCQPE